MVAMLSFDPGDDRYLRDLAEFVAIESVSRDAPPATMRRAAEWLRLQLDFANAEVVGTGGHPLVRGELRGPEGAPTVLVYGHYDVQPPGALEEWSAPPFQLTRDGELVRGRGVSDDKGPSYIAVQVARAFAAQEGRAPLHLKFLFEGEEEIGSPHLPDFLKDHAAELSADLVISADGAMWRPDEPSVATGSKGLLELELEVTGANRDLHSGRYGGAVANPLHALARLIAGLHDQEGRVAVPGFYAGIPELSLKRRLEIRAIAFDEDEYRRELGLPALFGEPGYSPLERLWERPTLEVNGVEGGGAYTVIPHRARAHITCRLVLGQEPEAVLAAITGHLRAQPAPGLTISIAPHPGGAAAYTLGEDHRALGAAVAALEAVYPRERVLLTKIGGTLPAAALFQELLGLKTLFFSFSTADERLHAPNEFFRVRRLREGMRAWEWLLRELAAGPHRLSAPTSAEAA